MNDALREVVNDFLNDNPELFESIWMRNDSPTDSEIDAISDTWYDEYSEVAEWQEVEDLISEMAMDYDWSNQMEAMVNDQPYVMGDILFDADREDRLFGGN